MLVLSRKKDEKLMIGDEIEVQIVKISKDSVRIGIKAPSNVSVHRYEVYENIRETNLAATKSQLPPKKAFKNLLSSLNSKTK
jgi:carbon storage regulator